MKKLIIIISCLTALYSFSATENANHVYSPNTLSKKTDDIEIKLVELETISMSSGIINVFSKDGNGAIWNKWFNGKKWSKWENLGGKISENSQISAVSWGVNRIDLFVKGMDKSVHHKWWNGSNWNNGWENLGGEIPENSQISAVSWGANRIDLFVKGMDKSVHHKWWNGSNWNNGWENLGGEIPENSQISAVSWGANRIDLFVKGIDSQKFTLKDAGEEYFYILSNTRDKRALHVEDHNKDSKAKISLWEIEDKDNFKWKFIRVDDHYYIQSKLGTYLDLQRFEDINGIPIWMWKIKGNKGQKWKLKLLKAKE